MIYFLKADERKHIRQGKFLIRLLCPGASAGMDGDHGLGPLGRLDHSTIEPGGLIPMHTHKNDEILSYMRRGTMRHTDSHGLSEGLHARCMMMMNAGMGLCHEEGVADDDAERVDMLQLFFRPRKDNPEPRVQFHRFRSSHSLNAWRLIGGPEYSDAPLKIRSEAWVYDCRLQESGIETPEPEALTALLYVFEGSIVLCDQSLSLGRGDSLVIRAERIAVSAAGQADLVLLLLDEQSVYSRSGACSG